MKKIVLFFTIVILQSYTFAQQINTNSGNTQLNDFSAEWIVGGSLIDNSVFSINDEKQAFSNEQFNIGLIDVYPTTTSDFLTITCKNQELRALNYKITNSSGTNFISGNFDITTPFELDVKGLTAGFYFIIFSFENGESLITRKFIKL